jgi:hypothetical protein
MNDKQPLCLNCVRPMRLIRRDVPREVQRQQDVFQCTTCHLIEIRGVVPEPGR